MAELQRLETAWDVDRHIVMEGEKVVLIRFSNFEKPPDEALAKYTTTTTTSFTSAKKENKDRERSKKHKKQHHRSSSADSSSNSSDSDSGSMDSDSDDEEDPYSASSSSRKRNRHRMSKKNDNNNNNNSNDQLSHTGGMEYYTQTQQMDEILTALAPKVRKYCSIYLVSTVDVDNFNVMYELGHDREPFALMFFYRNQHIRVDLGTGNQNKINFLMDEEDLLTILNSVYRTGKLGKTITSSEKRFNMVSLRR